MKYDKTMKSFNLHEEAQVVLSRLLNAYLNKKPKETTSQNIHCFIHNRRINSASPQLPTSLLWN